MSCDDVEHALEYHGLDGLTPELQRHVDRCRHCRSVVKALSSLEDSLRALPVPPASTRLAQVPLPELQTSDVIAERRAEAAQIDWFETIGQVEVLPRRRFGVPRIVRRRRSWGTRLALGGLAAAVLIILGLVAAVVWNDLRSDSNAAGTTFTRGEAAGAEQKTLDALERR